MQPNPKIDSRYQRIRQALKNNLKKRKKFQDKNNTNKNKEKK